MQKKYFKPKSLTWWASAVPLLLGLFMAFESVHGLVDYVTAVKTATGLSAPVLINMGLAGIRTLEALSIDGYLGLDH